MTGPPSDLAAGVARWAARTPERVAVSDDTGGLTFAELDGLAGTLARRLVERTAGRGGARHPVPVLVRRDRWSAVAVHGALRAGVAFVPLAADSPAQVLDEAIARVGPAGCGVVTDPELAGALAGWGEVLVVPRTVDDPVAPQPVALDDVAVVLFTSGSTGRPKGVVLDWSGLVPRFAEIRDRYTDPTAVHVAVTAPFEWVAGLTRVGIIGTGASMATTATRFADPVDLLEWLDREAVTEIVIVPSMAGQVAGRWPAGRRLEAATSVRLGGEPGFWEQVAGLRALVAPAAVIVSAYGATETTGATVLVHEIGPDAELGSGPLPLGRPPVAGRVRFLAPSDDADADAPREIVVGGALARGYLDDPELTAARFFVEPDGTRWWRSGDLVRVDASGCAWSAGRVDDLVKINGRLVEPAEPERVLRELHGVRDAAVVPHESEHGVRLAGHLVVDDTAGLTPARVRAHCRDRLAPHLVPSPLVRHDRLPVLENGKVDRARLRAEPLRPWRSTPSRDTSVDFERWCLVEVRRIIGFDDIGADDDLFAMGLDSLGVAELSAAIVDAGHGDFDPSRLLAARTVAGISGSLGPIADRGASTVTVLNGAGRCATVFALPGGGGTAIRFRSLAEALGPDRPVAVIEPRGLHRRGRPDRSVERLAGHADAEVRARLGRGEPCVLLGYSASGPVAYEAAGRLYAAGHPVHLVLLDTAPSLPDAATLVSRPASGVGVRGASWPELPGALARSLRYRSRHPGAVARAWRLRWRNGWLERFPGRPRFSVDRYDAFRRIMVRADAAYAPVPATFPATLIHVAGNDFALRCRQLIPDLTVHRVGGDHATVLEPPEVERVAALIAAVTDALTGPPPG